MNKEEFECKLLVAILQDANKKMTTEEAEILVHNAKKLAVAYLATEQES